MVTRTPLMAGNWKMNFDHLQSIAFVQKLAWTLKDGKHDFGAVEVAVFPPFTDLRSVQTLVDADKLKIAYGGQDLSPHESGAYTGDISGRFLSALGCRYVLVGHSERRTLHGETDEICRDKVAAAARSGLVPVLCVGETSEDLEAHGAAAVPVSQLRAALEGNDAVTELVIAYEPVWAIGSGEAATPEQAQTVCRALRETLAELRGDDMAGDTRLLYGGSVKASNVVGFMREPDIDGALIGGASLKIDEFSAIVRYRQHVGS
ncbi:triosephosphate isomerase [Pseudoclavibacter endophyticus]|uniref:Triosephosphate isomerase n=1 Tax=Pseudoclavibacter endophyticus TaxID=1778590 RepID=A0A6H9WUH3_9MICO|nr:triose-phosphate isomerase [Pseudoclavibacter endophyticus]KAB1650134.1 triose-phosphate isomerase [Pseudoclavibacter endophyticus]GGA56858.1 triosephosphate isomerase [Pseudoclavibacter endophyticus]